MDVKQFSEMFKGAGVRTWIDWSQIVRPGFRIVETYSCDRAVLGDLFTPWYLTAAGKAGDWRNDDDHPVRVSEATSVMTVWPRERSQRINTFIERFSEDDEPVHLILPTAIVGRDDMLLLDGTHRAAAAYLTGGEVRLFLYALSGPLNSEILPDVAHFPYD